MVSAVAEYHCCYLIVSVSVIHYNIHIHSSRTHTASTNVFGFTPVDGSGTSNFGLRDQIAALTWIQQNIDVCSLCNSTIS